MASLNVHMPPDLRAFVDQRTKKGGFSTPTDYVRHLIREDQRREAERHVGSLAARGAWFCGSAEPIARRSCGAKINRSGDCAVLAAPLWGGKP